MGTMEYILFQLGYFADVARGAKALVLREFLAQDKHRRATVLKQQTRFPSALDSGLIFRYTFLVEERQTFLVDEWRHW